MKRNKKTIDDFFIKNKDILLKDNQLITFREVKSLGKDFYNWYQAIVRPTNKTYKTMKNFKKFHGIIIGRHTYKWDKELIDSFFLKNREKIVDKDNNIITYSRLKKLGKDFDGWYQSLNRGNGGYLSMADFKKKNNLSKVNKKYFWTKEKADNFFLKKRKILTNGDYMIPYKKICSLGLKYRSWHYAISGRKKNKVYENYDDFKRTFNLKTGKTKSIK